MTSWDQAYFCGVLFSIADAILCEKLSLWGKERTPDLALRVLRYFDSFVKLVRFEEECLSYFAMLVRSLEALAPRHATEGNDELLLDVLEQQKHRKVNRENSAKLAVLTTACDSLLYDIPLWEVSHPSRKTVDKASTPVTGLVGTSFGVYILWSLPCLPLTARLWPRSAPSWNDVWMFRRGRTSPHNRLLCISSSPGTYQQSWRQLNGCSIGGPISGTFFSWRPALYRSVSAGFQVLGSPRRSPSSSY